MFGIGFWESIIILIMIIVLVKPEDIPEFIRKVGRVFGKIKRSYDLMVHNIRDIEYKIKNEIDDFSPADKVYNDFEKVYGKNKRKKKARKRK